MTSDALEVRRLQRIQRLNTARWSIAAVLVSIALILLVSLVVNTIGDLQAEVALLREQVATLEAQVRELGGIPRRADPSAVVTPVPLVH